MTLRPGLLALADDRIMELQWFEGLERHAADARRRHRRRCRRRSFACSGISKPPTTPGPRRSRRRGSGSTGSTRASPRLPRRSPPFPAPIPPAHAAPASEATFWADALVRQCRTMQDELAFLAPWSALPAAPSGFGDLPGIRDDSDVARACGRSKRNCCRPSSADGARTHRPRTRAWLDDLGRAVAEASRRAAERMAEIERLALQCDELARMEYDFLYDSARHLLAIGYNVGERRRDPSYYDLLASEARFASFVAIAQGQLAAGELVRARAPAHDRGGAIGAPVLERLDVRVPDAAAGDADVRQHAARPDLSRDGGAADRVREAARRALGHLGMRLQLGRCEPQLPVPRLRRARPGAEARTRGGSRRRALRVGARADGGARGGVPQPAAACRRRARRTIRPLRGDRLHAGAPAARAIERRRAFVHGASPGHDPALAGAPAARPSDAEALRVGPAVQGDAAAAAGAHSEGRGALLAPRRAFRDARAFRRSGGAGARPRQSRHADTGSAAAVERPLPRHGHERGRRQHAAGRTSPSPAGAKTAPATTGARSATSATWRAGYSGRPRISRRASAPSTTRRYSPKRAPNFAGATTTSNRTPRSSSRRKTTSSCAGSASPTARGRGGRSTSRATRKSCSRRRPRTRCIRRSPISSCRPRSSRSGKPSCARAGPARSTSTPPWMFHLMAVHGRRFAGRFLRDRPHGVHRTRTHGRRAAGDDRARTGCPAARARSWIRSSRSGIG